MNAPQDHHPVSRRRACDLNLGLDRRTFLAGCAAGLGLLAVGPATAQGFGRSGPAQAPPGEEFLTEARYYEKLPHRKIRCTLCPRQCEIDDQERGYCGVRENREGVYYTLVHSRPVTWHVDPIEKKPFYHVLPGTHSYSIATVGCNVACKFCQNWQISQVRPEQVPSFVLPPEELATFAVSEGARSVAYTYTEPVIFYEYMRDSAIACKAQNLKNVMVSGGYIQPEPLAELCTHLDAVKIDLKAFSEKFYREIVSGELKPVLKTLELLVEKGVWTEIVYLVIPTLNDSDEEFTNVCRWIKSALGPNVPIHFTRFHPAYLLQDLPPTPLATLESALQIGRAEGLNFVYLGNVPGHSAEHTRCPRCGTVLIERRGYAISMKNFDAGKCAKCGMEIPGVWT